MHYIKDITEMIGNTPLLRLNRVTEGTEATVLAKCEFLNPFSIKDRPVLNMLRTAAAEGLIKPGTEIVEASSGNTAMAIAYISNIMGFKAKIFMSELMSLERRKLLRTLGAELVLTPADEGTRGARERAMAYCEGNDEAFYLYQHGNINNPMAHHKTTAEEIWRDTEGKIDIFVCGLGTSGTFAGVSSWLKPKKPEIKIIGFEPRIAPLYSTNGEAPFKAHRIMGVGPGFVTENFERAKDNIDEIFLVDEEMVFPMVRRLAKEEGIMVGISSGASAHVACEVAKRPENKGKVIVCMLYDTGQRYLSVEGLFDVQ
jgi:cysteine synthase A